MNIKRKLNWEPTVSDWYSWNTSPIVRLWDREVKYIKHYLHNINNLNSPISIEYCDKKKSAYPNTFSKYSNYKIVGYDSVNELKLMLILLTNMLEKLRKEEHENQSYSGIIKVHKIDAKYVDGLIKKVNPNIYLKSYDGKQVYNRDAETPFSYTIHNAKDEEEGKTMFSIIYQALRTRRLNRMLNKRSK